APTATRRAPFRGRTRRTASRAAAAGLAATRFVFPAAGLAAAGARRGVGRAIQAIGQDIGYQLVVVQRVGQILLELLEVLGVDVNARIAGRIDVLSAAVDREISRQAPVHRAGAVVLAGIQGTIAVAIIAEQQPRRHTLDQQ